MKSDEERFGVVLWEAGSIQSHDCFDIFSLEVTNRIGQVHFSIPHASISAESGIGSSFINYAVTNRKENAYLSSRSLLRSSEVNIAALFAALIHDLRVFSENSLSLGISMRPFSIASLILIRSSPG